ncbi:MAG: SagB/ThcOx family dehydrogenase [Syntrophaceae bacterium]|nr:SagB/ThcOx family dehydrogenase [Syntrophaceae bacterium]
MIKKIFFITLLSVFGFSSIASAAEVIKLPPPQLNGGKSLMQALKERRSERSFDTKKLPVNVLANMLWAACGINRPEAGKLTAPSAMNRQQMDVYVALPEGLYLYEAKGHILKPIVGQDIRALTGKQSFVAQASLTLIYVADFKRMGNIKDEEKNFYAATDTGFISENVYLFCASEGLGTVVRGSIDKEALAKAMKLGDHQKIVLAQSVGYPKE